ncbi:MAG: SdiA-regulated domain-containing protein [Neisseriaceae bacterium]|nr:SdiA-regulated domain-containing protein [Neisseriaceae bacterium]
MTFFPVTQRTSRLWRCLVVCLCLLVVGGCAFVAIRFFHLPYHLECVFTRCGDEAKPLWGDANAHVEPALGPDLNHLTVSIDRQPIIGVDQNLSGLAYMAETDQLVAVLNRPGTLLVLSTEGKLLRRHPLSGASDTEGVAYLGNNKVAVLQEKKRTIVVLDLPQADGERIDASQALKYPLPMVKQRNSGPEGMGYDEQTDTLYVVKEKDSRGLYAVKGLMSGGPVVHEDLSHLLVGTEFATDLSSVEFDPVGRHLLLLSDEAQTIFTLSLDGALLQSRSINPDAGNGFTLPMPQPEGVAIGAHGRIYVVSEPNLFTVLVPTAPIMP